MRRHLVVLLSAVVLMIPMIGSASAAGFSGRFAPTIYGGLADMTGNASVTPADTWMAFYGETSILDGGLDCDAWTGANTGEAGSGGITADDDCTLIGYDGTANGVEITVSNGKFVEADGISIPDGYVLPTTFNAGDPDNPSVVAAQFGWEVLNGRVDANGDGDITGDDCSVGTIPGGDGNILGNDCGFATTYAAADLGLVDWNGDLQITAADDTGNGFFGHPVVDGFVQMIAVAPGAPTITGISPTWGPAGTAVTITGTHLSGASVTVGSRAATIASISDTKIVTSVPDGLAAGAVSVLVMTAGGADSIGFTVTGATTTYTRSIDLRCHHGGSLIADGYVHGAVVGAYDSVPVRIQRRTAYGWRIVGRDRTNSGGWYRAVIPDRDGRYRAVALKHMHSDGTMYLRAVSPVHVHG